LRGNFDRFVALSIKDQQSLRQFDKQLRADPHAEELSHVMDRYYDWLKTLSPADRAELSEETNLQKRVALVKQDQERQVERTMTNRLSGGGRQIVLKDPDNQAVMRWMAAFAAKYRDKLNPSPTPDGARGDQSKGDGRRPGRPLVFQSYDLWWSPSAPVGSFPPVKSEDLLELRTMLSQEKQAEFDAKPGRTDQVSMVRNWIQTAWQEFRESAAQSARRGGGFLSKADRIKQFEKRLPADQRAQLEKLPENERMTKLEDLYNQRPRGQEGQRPGGQRRPPRDGQPPDEFLGPRGGSGPNGPGPNGSGPNGPPPND
jgi:hypothetical protein